MLPVGLPDNLRRESRTSYRIESGALKQATNFPAATPHFPTRTSTDAIK
jgi:hypothetical protein